MKSPLDTLEGFGVNSAWILVIFGLGFILFIFLTLDIESNIFFEYIFGSAPIWLPFITFKLFFESWLYYVRKDYNWQQGRVTLEIKVPQEVFRSPEAMELVLNQLHQTAAPDNHLQTYIDGKHPPKYGLEIVSRGGDIRFYINTPRKKFKNIIETQLYAQYPGIEVHELDIDYTAEVPWDMNKFQYFSIHFGLKKADAYPIKTYVDYGLNDMPKEEEKLDPISSMIEMLGSIGPGEFYWVQILIDANREVTFKEGALHKESDWKEAARAEIKKIIKGANERLGIDGKKEGQSMTMMSLSEGEKDAVKAIERSLGKNAFNTAIRAMYIAEKERFNPGERIGALITGWRSYDDLNRNAIGVRWRTDFNWNMWQDPSGRRKDMMKKHELHDYKARRYYTLSDGLDDSPKVMTTEELATIFHIPGKVIGTPSLSRIPSKRSEPPSNLPIG